MSSPGHEVTLKLARLGTHDNIDEYVPKRGG